MATEVEKKLHCSALAYFVSVANEGSFRASARKLKYSIGIMVAAYSLAFSRLSAWNSIS